MTLHCTAKPGWRQKSGGGPVAPQAVDVLSERRRIAYLYSAIMIYVKSLSRRTNYSERWRIPGVQDETTIQQRCRWPQWRERLCSADEAAATLWAHGVDPLRLAIEGTDVVDTVSGWRIPVAEASAGVVIDETVEYRHPATEELDENGQGNCHTAFAFVAHRAVVDVDPELGLVKVIQIATAQDVGNALNPLSVTGQIEGGIAQGLGLAVMEEIIQVDGVIRNANFTDYLLPTFLDMPPVVATLIEQPDPHAPLGAKGVGEPPCISSTPAIVAAIRDALRQAGVDAPLDRVPVRPADICL